MSFSKARIRFFLIFSLLFIFIFLNTFLASQGVLTNFALCLLFFLILLFVSSPQIGLLVLIILRVALDYFRDWRIFVIQDVFSLNFGALLGIFILVFAFCWIIIKRKIFKMSYLDSPRDQRRWIVPEPLLRDETPEPLLKSETPRFTLKNIPPYKIPNLPVIALFLIISLASIFYSLDRLVSLREWVRIASFFTIYLLVFDFIRSGKIKLKFIQKTLLASAIIPSIFGFWQIFTETGFKDEAGFTRIYGSFAHPNAFSYFLVIILTLLIYFFIIAESRKAKRWYLSSILLGITLLVFTYSRGAWLAFLIILLLFGLLKYRKLLFKSLIIVVLSTLLLWGIDNFFQKNYNFSPLLNFAPSRRLIETFSLQPYTSSFWRIELWQEMIDVFWKRPILGHGLGSFEEEALKQRGFYAGSLEAHNDFLHLSVELGIIGLVSYILLILIVLKNIIKIYRKTEDKNFKIFILSFLCLFISLFLVSSVENILRNTIVQWCFWAWAGCVFSYSVAALPLREKGK